MLTRKPLTITVIATHHRCDGLAGSSSPPVRAPDCGKAVASGRAMSLPILGNPPKTRACKLLTSHEATWPAAALLLRMTPWANHQLAWALPLHQGFLLRFIV